MRRGGPAEEALLPGEEPVSDAGAQDADGGSGQDIGGPMLLVDQTKGGDAAGYGVGPQPPAPAPAVFFADDLCTPEGDGRMAGGEGMQVAAVGAFACDKVLQPINTADDKEAGSGCDGQTFLETMVGLHAQQPEPQAGSRWNQPENFVFNENAPAWVRLQILRFRDDREIHTAYQCRKSDDVPQSGGGKDGIHRLADI